MKKSKRKKTATQRAIDSGLDITKVIQSDLINTAPYPEDMGLCEDCLNPLNGYFVLCKDCQEK